MSTNYIKVRQNVAKKLGLIGQRAEYPDGDIQLYEKDLSLIDRGWVFGRRDETVSKIGGYIMDPYRNRQEHQKEAKDCINLPYPTDPAWRPTDGQSETVPSETVPSETVPSETVPSETVPSETVTSETVPSETVPSETVTSETVPSEAEQSDLTGQSVQPQSEPAGTEPAAQTVQQQNNQECPGSAPNT